MSTQNEFKNTFYDDIIFGQRRTSYDNKEGSPSTVSKHVPEGMRQFSDVLLSERVCNYTTALAEASRRFCTMHQDSNIDHYTRLSHDIITFYVKNGSRNISEYQAIFKWQCNKLYMRHNAVKDVCNDNMLAIIDDAIAEGYNSSHIVDLICVLLNVDLGCQLANLGIECIDMDGSVTLLTHQYGEFIEFLCDLDRIKFLDLISNSTTLYKVVNYYFCSAVISIGMTPCDFHTDMIHYLMEHFPLGVALEFYIKTRLDVSAVSQGDVADMGYLDLIKRSVKSTIDMPNQLHVTARSFADSTASIGLCADKMSDISNQLLQFITAFVDRSKDISDKLTKESISNIIEVFIDFMSDLPNLKAVSKMRWITYISRILRIFLPDCMTLAINIFNTYIASLFAVVSQGFDDLIQTLIVVITGTIALRSVPDKASVNKMVEFMKIGNLTIPFSKNMVSFLTTIFSLLPDIIRSWFIQYIPEHMFYQLMVDKYGTVIDDIDRFLTYDIDTIYFNKMLSAELMKLYVDAHELVKDMAPFAKDNSGEFSLLRELLRKFDKMYDSFISISKCGVIRECPFSLTIYGDSQIGKSTLSSAIARYMFPDTPADRVRYVVPTDPDEFWSGYSPFHKVTAEDDADQDAEYNNALQLFSIVTNAPYQPPMASVDDRSIGVKGTPYHSKMHIRCTNNAYPRPSTKVLTVEAYWKRRHMLVWAKVKPDYFINGKVQYSPVFKHLEFYLLDSVDPSSMDNPKLIGDLDVFLCTLKNRYNTHMANEERIVAMMSGSTDSFLSDLSEAYNNTSLLPDAQGKLTDMMHEQLYIAKRPLVGLKDRILLYLSQHPNIERGLKIAATVAAISGTLTAMVTMYNSLFNRTSAIAEAIPSGDVRTNKYKKIKRPAYSEGTSDHTAENLVNEVVRGRQAYCEVYDRRTLKCNAMCGIFIGGRYLLLPNHLFIASDGKLVEENSRFVIRTDQSVFEQMFESNRYKQLITKEGLGKDACVYECTMQVRAFKDIRHHFISESDLTYLVNWGEAALNKFNNGVFERQLVTTNIITNQKYKHLDVLEPFTIYKGFQYDAITMSGDCGSMLVVYNTRIVGKIIGMHVAGERDRHRGYSELITSDMLVSFVPRVQPRNRPVTVDDKPAVILPEGNYTYYGTVPATEAVYPVSRTEIKPSVIHGSINPPKTFPVSLDRRNFGQAVSKYFNINMPINPQIKQVLLQDACDIADCMDSYKLGVVTEYEAINGNHKYPYFERMNMSTSPGLPYKKLNKGKGKESFFSRDDIGNWVVSHPHLRTAIDTRIQMAKQGLSYDSMWMDIPKDERRKPGKGTRMIITPPLDYQIVFRRYFMDYIVAFYNNKLIFHSAVGINPYSYDWTEMANNLLAVSDVGGDGDHTGFDGGILTDLLEIEIHAINHYYRYESDHEVNALVREVLWNEIIHTPTQCVNVAYLTHCGMPSGCNCTTIVNTNVNDRYYKLAWLGLAPVDKRTIKSFYEHVKVYCYGDDSIAAIKREALSFYNYKTIAENLAIYGVKFTMADKSGAMLESKPVLDCTFLKNSFRREGMIYHALMNEDTLNDMVNWIRESDDDYAATVVNCNMALMMWYHYGVDRFNLERGKLLNALGKLSSKYSNVPSLLTYDYLDDCFRMDRTPIADTTVGVEEVSFSNVDAVKPSLFQRLTGRGITAVSQGKDIGESTSHATAGEVDDANTKLSETIADAITFIEQKPSIDIDKSIAMHKSEELMFGHWSIQRIFGKPQRVGTYAFATTNVRNDVLKAVALPDVLFKIAVWRPMMSAFTFMKYRPVFRIQLNGNKFAAGRLVAFITPFTLTNGNMFPSAEGNTSGYTGFDHVFLDASSNDTVTITAPWVYPREWINIATNVNGPNVANRYIHVVNSSYNNGFTHTLRLQVLNALNVGTGASTTIYATIWLHLEEVEMCVPQISTATSQGGTHSYITNNVTNWEKVASQTLPSNVRGDVFDLDANLKVSTMDKPNVTLSPEYFVRRAFGYMGHAVNFEHLDRLALYPGGQSDIKHTDFGTNVDEMSLSYLTSKFTLAYTATISTTNGAGSVLFNSALTPYVLPSLTNQPAPQYDTLTTSTWQPAGSKSQIPLLGYVSLPFNFWGGSLKYRFDFITNAFVTAKLFCAIVYGTASPEAGISAVEPTSTLGYTFELNGDNKSFEVEVPYVADRPWKRVMNTQFITSTVGIMNQNFDDVIGDTCCIGQLILYVINPLTIPNGFPTSYDFNVFVAGGKDFRLNYISRANTPWVPIAQGNIDPQPGTDLSKLGPGIYRNDLGCMSEVYTSVRDILKRYCHCATRFTKVPGAGTSSNKMYSFPQIFPVSELLMPFFASPSGNINNPSNIMNWFLALYRVWRGSLRFKLLFSVENEQGVKLLPPGISVDYMPNNFNAGVYTSVNDRILAMGTADESIGSSSELNVATSTTLYNTTHHAAKSMGNDTCPFVEIEVPFVYPNRVAPIPLLGNDGISNLDYTVAPTTRAITFANEANNFGSLIVNYPRTPEDFFVLTRIFIAVGDDFRAGCQIGQPKVFYAGFKGTGAGTNYSIPPDCYS